MMKKISLYLIDDHKVFLQSFQSFIQTQAAFDWYGSHEGDKEDFDLVIRIQPDVILLDFHLRFNNGMEWLKQLREGGFEGKIIFLSMNRDVSIRREASLRGADGFVSKEADGHLLLKGIQNLMNGSVDYLEVPQKVRNTNENPFHLTPQEALIAQLICKGVSSDEVARQLFISIHTVHTHRRRILDKTNAENFFQVCRKINDVDF